MDWEVIEILDTLIVIAITIFAGMFAYYSSIIVAEEKRAKRARNHIDNLPKKREEGFPFQKKPLTSKGQFDKQRTTYTDGDNT